MCQNTKEMMRVLRRTLHPGQKYSYDDDRRATETIEQQKQGLSHQKQELSQKGETIGQQKRELSQQKQEIEYLRRELEKALQGKNKTGFR